MRSIAGKLLIMVSTFAIAAPAAAPAGAAEPAAKAGSGRGCWYYGDANFQGPRAEIVEGAGPASLGPDWNDKISSLTCHPLCTLTAYEGENQTGARKNFNGDIRAIPAAWNDKISSMTISCRRRVRSIG
ncbi:MAG TPA: hypothetical protein VIT45_00050 [Allosphingosinicella sp.]